MPADANIFQQYLQAPKSVADYTAMYDQADARKNALQQSVLALQKGQMDMANAADVNRQRNALRDAVNSGQLDLSNPDHTSRALAIAPDVAPAMLKTVQDSATSRAKATLDTAQAGQATAQTGKISAETMAQAVAHMSDVTAALMKLPGVTPAHVVASIQNAGKMYGIPDALVQQAVSQVPQDPAQLPAFLQAKNAQNMSAKERMAYVAPDANTVANNTTHITGINIQQAGENQRNRANIAKDYNVAGLNQDGTPGTSNDSMVDAIGQYKVAPPNGMALRNPRMQQILADVTAKYPDFDATQYGARQTAAKAFSTGPQAQQVQAGNTALNHLETIEQLALAQKNGNVQLFNRLANTIGTQLGQPAPTNLKAAITMVGPEISKAVIGAGGSAGERDKAEQMLNPNASPDQMLGSVGTIKELFGGRLAETARTYQRSTGRKDFADSFLSPAAQKVLAARTQAPGGGAAPAAPAGWKYIGTVN